MLVEWRQKNLALTIPEFSVSKKTKPLSTRITKAVRKAEIRVRTDYATEEFNELARQIRPDDDYEFRVVSKSTIRKYGCRGWKDEDQKLPSDLEVFRKEQESKFNAEMQKLFGKGRRTTFYIIRHKYLRKLELAQ